METTLHQQLKLLYASSHQDTEVVVQGFRIDAISESGELVEIQHASLGALRDKTKRLLIGADHSLRIVKPIIARKNLVTLTRKNGSVKRQRLSPKRGEFLDVFEDLVHFCTVFPKKRLSLEIVLIAAEEVRVDRKQRGWRKKNYRSLDTTLVEVLESVTLQTRDDILRMLPVEQLPMPFDTAELAAALDRPRWFAQKVAYCLRQTGAAKPAGKRRHANLYRIPTAQLRRLKAA